MRCTALIAIGLGSLACGDDGGDSRADTAADTQVADTAPVPTTSFASSVIDAVFNDDDKTTTYTLSVQNPDAEPLTVTWEGPNCGTFRPTGTSAPHTETTREMTMVWHHPHPPCGVVLSHADARITATIAGTSGTLLCSYNGGATSASPQPGPPCTSL